MDLKRILSLLLTLEAAGKLEGRSLPALYDPNGDITLTVRAVDVATREQFLADVADEAAAAGEAKIMAEYKAAVDKLGTALDAAKKPAKLGGKKGK